MFYSMDLSFPFLEIHGQQHHLNLFCDYGCTGLAHSDIPPSLFYLMQIRGNTLLSVDISNIFQR